MRPETRRAMEMLYYSMCNVPEAAESCNLSVKEMKICFAEFLRMNPPNWEGDEE